MQPRAISKRRSYIRLTSHKITGSLLAAVLLLCQQSTIVRADKDDPCTTKSQPGLCKEWSECPVIRALIDSGQYSKREVVSCGFGIREEMICCPKVKTDTKIEVSTPTNVETTTQRDFWLDVLEELKTSTTTTTTPKPDFWLPLLSTTTTTTTTIKPLVIDNTPLDQSSEFYDFSQLLKGKSTGNQRREVNTGGVNNQQQVDNSQNLDSSGNSFQPLNHGNGGKNLNSGPVNINQWNLKGETSFAPNNNNNRGNLNQNGRGLPSNINFQNNGRGINTNGNFQGNNRRGGPGANLNGNLQNMGQLNGPGGGGRGPNFNGNLQNMGQLNGPGGGGRGLNFNGNLQHMGQLNGPGGGGRGPNFNGNLQHMGQLNGPSGRGPGPNLNGNFQNNGWGNNKGSGPNFNGNFQNNGRGNNKGSAGGPNFNGNFQNNGQGNNKGAGRGPNFPNNEQGIAGVGQIPNYFQNSGANLNPNFNGNGNQFQPSRPNQGFSFPLNQAQNSNADQYWAATEVNQFHQPSIVELPNQGFSFSPNPVENPNWPGTTASQDNRPKEASKDLLNSVFKTPDNSNINPNAGLTNVDEVIWNIFNEHQQQKSQPNVKPGNPTVLWLNNPKDTAETHVVFVDPNIQVNQPFQKLTMPSGEILQEANDLEVAESNRYVEAVLPESTTYNPIQIVFDNLVNSGMEIVKAKPGPVQRGFQPQTQQQHFGQTQGRHLGQQPNQQQHQFGNQPNQQPHHQTQVGQQGQFVAPFNPQQQFGQQPGNQQHPFIQQPNQPHAVGPQPNGQQQIGSTNNFGPNGQQQNINVPQHTPRPGHDPTETQWKWQGPTRPAGEAKQPRTPNPSIQTPTDDTQLPAIQTPAENILDPFKPFEFRPPPGDDVVFTDGDNSISPNPVTPSPTNRPAARACERILRNLYRGLSPHILGGTPAELGEFPHMAAIGYSRLGDDGQGPYDIRCGGSLIDDRFVLTAAHCVAARDSVPAIVRMGVVNFTDPVSMQDAVEIKIKQVFIHDDYSQSSTYNDIAILELEKAPPLGEFIQPVCLYTDVGDPDTALKLYVTGWGTINTATRAFSDILLKARLQVTPVERCNDSFVNYGLTRQIQQGIIRTQLCAEDAEQIRDACQGDSGGPLNLVIDEAYKNYRLIGVVSSGFGCASTTPGLYTRVAAFLDFIERIVWPNGGD